MKLKNKDYIFLVVRKSGLATIDAEDIVCATTRTSEKAEELCGVYEQELLDAGLKKGDFTFYVQAQIYYDE